MKKRTDDELFFLVDFYYKNQEILPGKLVKKALEIDLIRNKFSKTVIYNYFLYFKRYLKDGYVCKGISKKLLNTFHKVTHKKELIKSQPKKQNILEQIEETNININNQITNMVAKYNTLYLSNLNKINELTSLNNKIQEVINTKKRELEEKRDNMINDILNNI